MNSRRLLLGVTILSVALSGCISDPTGPGNVGVLSAVSGNGQVGPVNSTLPADLVVQARRSDGSPISSLEITGSLPQRQVPVRASVRPAGSRMPWGKHR